MESGQINAIMQVSGGNGDKGTESAGSQELLARIKHKVFCFCMEWQTADWPHECYIALRSPQMPHKEPRKLDHSECDEYLCSLAEEATKQAALCVQCQDPQSPLSYSIRPNMSCRAYLEKSTPSAHPYHILLFLPSCAHLAQLCLPLHTFTPFVEWPACECFLKCSICPWIPI